ncbi:MAG: class I SAM-dependent methyltransferase [Anaerolineales bacterium]|nr:class I SAM-dependent methyltransferase [Anaerolineales bacterium]
MNEIKLKPGRERSVLKRHPWIFSGAIAKVIGQPDEGETVEVISHQGDWLARAAYSPHSQIRSRIWSWDRDEIIDAEFFQRRLRKSIRARQLLASDRSTSAYREVHAESDGIPGLIVDRYNEIRVLQMLSVGIERWKDVIVDFLKQEGDCAGIYERSDAEVRQLEGLSPRVGHVWGKKPDGEFEISEYDLRFRVNIHSGHKTGFYLDQRENRRLVRNTTDVGEVLNCFAYTGGFTIAAMAAGAESVISIDTSAKVLELGRENITLNELSDDRCEWVIGDVFTELRRLRDENQKFDTIILDPPRFARTKSQVKNAARGYKDINLLAFKLLKPEGLLYTFSCSGAITPELFNKIVAGAALDADVTATVVQWMYQPTDHPVLLSFPEGRYLKGLVCRVTS